MKQIKIMMISKRKIKRNLLIITASTTGVYILISLYFISHFFFHTQINGIWVSMKAHHNAPRLIGRFIRDYELTLITRNGITEIITSQEIGMYYNKSSSLSPVTKRQRALLWLGAIFRDANYYIKDLYSYDKTLLNSRIDELRCLNGNIIEPHNVDFIYKDGSFVPVKEIRGTRVNKAQLLSMICQYISEGRQTLDLDLANCYEPPKYTLTSKKTQTTKNQLNRYLSTKVTYQFGDAVEQLDRKTLHKWLSIDDDLEAVINLEEVADYVNVLSKKYNTVGIVREFQSTPGRKVELRGGLYGWKIDRVAETEALYNNIMQADIIEREPVYLQRAFSREGNEIGNTYVEINISRQYLWFYKDGRLLTQGPVVTGNPNRGHATVLGAYMLNYKQKNATLTGPGYEAPVAYWMPFFGNIGLHDASWRSRFGGEIYLRNGSHGCVNAPRYLAKTVFENIEEGIPVILYKEE